MKLIDREMKVVETITGKSNSSLYCQASINSNGCITLRNYNISDKNSDEIIILSAEETEAIFELMRVLKMRENSIPF